MSVNEVLNYIWTSVGSIGFIVFICFLFPEKVEKWSVILWKGIYFVLKRGEKRIITHDIQGRVNNFAKSLKKEIANYEPVGIKIEWITQSEKPSEFFRENRLIIRMRQHQEQNKNFVYGSMLFLSKAFLTKTKRYLSPSQKESVDIFVGRKLFEKEKPQVADRFFEDFFSPRALSSNRIMELLEKYETIDKVGLFFPVLVQELTFLGEKVFYKPKNESIITEVREFVNFLREYADREIGEIDIPKNFEGAYCRCGIVIIAQQAKRQIGNLDPYIRHIERLLVNKLENIYLIGSASKDNKHFICRISQETQAQFGLQKYTCTQYRSKIKIGGERKEVDSYLILLRSPNVLRYYDREYQDEFIKVISD